MKRIPLIFLALLAALVVLTGCERPAQEAPTASAPLVDPNSAFIPEVKPDEALEVPVEAYPGPDELGAPPTADAGAGDVVVTDGAASGDTAATDETTTVDQPIPTEIIHEVQSGDTLFDISLRYGISVEAIVAANALLDPDRLEIGQKLIIPSSEDAVVIPGDSGDAAGDSGDAGAASGTPEQIHIVSSGETLYRIGLLYGFTVDEIVAYNNLANPNQLEVGQEIKIPPGE